MSHSSIDIDDNSLSNKNNLSTYSHHHHSHLHFPSHWSHTSTDRPLSIFHPTRIIHRTSTGTEHEWTSRSNRKNTVGHMVSDRTPHKFILWYFVSWKPHLFSWWNALSFTIGSVFFIVTAVALLIPSIAADEAQSLAYGDLALAGACLFTVGGTCQVLEILQAKIDVDATNCVNRTEQAIDKHGQSGRPTDPVHKRELIPHNKTDSIDDQSPDSHNSEHDNSDNRTNTDKQSQLRTGFDILADKSLPMTTRLKQVFGQWNRLDYTLAVIQWFGVILFNVNSVLTAGFIPAGIDPTINPPIFLGLTIFPDITASCLFIVSGYMQVIEGTHRLLPNIEPNNIGWLAGWNNTLGGIGFLINAVNLLFAQTGNIPNIPLLIGSWFFFVGSFVLWYEQCKQE